MGAFGDLLGQLDPDPRRRGTQFEHICKWFLTNDPLFKARLRHVWLWKEWPDRWSDTEAGIDLVAEDYDGQLWAVQAKAYAEDRDIPKRELDKFLSESNQTKFSERMLIATTDGLHHIARRTMATQEKDVSFVGLSDLREADEYLDWRDSPDDLRPSPPPTPGKPHDYQHEAINDVVGGFENADRGQLIMACGTGKTLTSLFIKEALAAQRTLVLLPSLSLLKQTLRVWSANKTEDFASLPVCSDSTVSRDDDAAVMYTSDLGVPVTTDALKIEDFLRKSGPRVVFSTYQSSPQIAAAFKMGTVPAFDLVIADEAHRCAGPVSSDFAAILDATAINAKRRLFMTATPRFFTGRVIREAERADFAYASMDDEQKFGTVFHSLGFSDAIKRGLLTDYQVAVIGVDDALYQEWAERGRLVTLDGKTPINSRTLAGQIGLAKAMRKYQLRRTISFHTKVKNAKQFAASMHNVLAWMPPSHRPEGILWAEHASGEMSAGQRGRLIQRLGQLADDERGLLTNARCLAEGVDVPTLDGVAFIDPRRSEVDIVQAVGRAIRKSDEKTVGTIVIPVFIDAAEDPRIALDNSVFKPVWDVVKALRAHDDELGRQLDELRRELGRHNAQPRLPDKIHLDVPASVSTGFADAFNVRLVEQSTASWEFWVGMLERFAEHHGHARIPVAYVADKFKLGEWANQQRDLYSSGKLPPDRQRHLQSLPGWTWDPHAANWEDGFQHLLDYLEHHGDARVQKSYVADDGYKLGSWAFRQRQVHAKGSLDPDRQHRLRELPGWTWDHRADKWDEGYQNLLRYVARHGDARIPQSYTVDGYKLGVWVDSQRGKYSKGTLAADRQRRLQDTPGWVWDTQAAKWEEGFQRLQDYVEHHGDARVPYTYVADGYPLGTWVVNQRSYNARGQLDSERERRLQNVTGWTWDAYADKWEEGYERLKEYVDSHGDASIPKSYAVDGYPLGAWVGTQRAFYAKGRLEPDRERRLQSIPGWSWDPFADKWEEGFRRLLNYVDIHGGARVPRSYSVDGYKLGDWVIAQRHLGTKGKLEPHRRSRLDDVAGWVWDLQTAKWEEGYRRLVEYADSHGDARAPKSYVVDDYPLGSWVGTQRSYHAKGKLDADRERRLQDLPGWTWDPTGDLWEDGFRRLLSYVARYGDARVPVLYTDDDYALGQWVHVQRRNHAKGTLDVHREQRLQDVTGWTWDARP